MTRGRTPRRSRSDSQESAHARLEAARTRVAPPSDLPEAALRFFDDVVTARESATWTGHDLHIAVILAKTLAHADEIDRQLSMGGYVTSDGKKNPLIGALLSCTQSINALSRALGLTAGARGISSASQERRNAADREAREVLDRISESDLLG